MQIDWTRLESKINSKELTFESFNFQVAWAKYSQFGDFEYDYNTPGAEFYLTLKIDCPELSLNTGDVIGWQAKFWVNYNDMNNTSMNSERRAELKDGFKKALRHKANIKRWIICTPGQIVDRARNELVANLRELKSDIEVTFWNRPKYEAFYLESHETFSPIFSHYFSTQFIGYAFIKEYTQIRIKRLRNKFDVELYVPSELDSEIELTIDFHEIFDVLSSILYEWRDSLKFGKGRSEQAISNIEKSNAYQVTLANLLKFMLELSEKLFEVFSEYKSCNDNLFNDLNTLKCIFNIASSKFNLLNKLIDEINTCPKSESDEHNPINRELNREIDLLFEHFKKFYGLYKKYKQSDIHIFGKAGFGKTNLACAICHGALERNVPALLILASDIRCESNIHKWIVDSLQVECDFNTLLGFLNNIGFLKRIKIPIVIDGLNETFPTASVWKSELDYLIQYTRKYEYIVLITTSRESYVKEIFDKTSYTEVRNNYYISGFYKYNLNLVLKKYFDKYRIQIKNRDFDKDLFKNPLFLKIFCDVHKGTSLSLYPTNIYETIEKYYALLIERVAAVFGDRNPIAKDIISKRIKKFSLRIWQNNSRYVGYPQEFVEIFDPNYTISTGSEPVISERVLDEGIFVKREIIDKREVVEFTFDLLGGFSIAMYLIFSDGNVKKIIERARNNDFWDKLINQETNEFVHPLAEDILKNVIYLFTKKTGKQLYEIVKKDIVFKFQASMLEILHLTPESRKGLVEHFISEEQFRPFLKNLFETVIFNISDKNDYNDVDLLELTLKVLSLAEIDLFWTESIRKNANKLLSYLHDVLKNNGYADKKIYERILFVALLLSSTNRFLRDKATKVLVYLGEKNILVLFKVYRALENIADSYIVERLLAALCGVILRSGSEVKEEILKIADYLERRYFQKGVTTHILILDYVDTILHYAAVHYAYERRFTFDVKKLSDWAMDEECRSKITSDGKATWGYGPIDTDFAKDTIGHHIASSKYSSIKTPTLKECLAMIIWRIKRLGYDDKLFADIDKECANIDYRYSRFDSSVSVERYGKKYSWIAYFELYGHFLLKGLLETEVANSFRVSSVDIDPTFPSLPRKVQLVTRCFLPRANEDVQKWVKRSEKFCLKDIYISNLDDGKEWVLLNSRHYQQNREGVRFDVNVDSILLPSNRVQEALYILNNSDNSNFDHRIEQYYYLFHGEIPWGKLIEEVDISRVFEGDNLVLYSPFAWFSWESYHSRMNDIGNVPFLSKVICTEFDLKYNINSFSFYTNKGEMVARFFNDSTSHYFFMRKDCICRFLQKYNLSFIWYEFGHRYGDFGLEGKKELDPAMQRFQSADLLT